MRYQDQHGNEITEGMYLRFEDGSVEQVYACQTGDESDLGINASNEVYLQAHEPELELRQPDMMG